MSRSSARREALGLLYEADCLDQAIGVVLARHRHDLDEQPDPYALELVTGVERRLGELDARIREAAEHWTLERMPLVDRNLLRLATYELAAHPEVPTAVVLDEAIELAKLLSTEESGRFVNGVLGTIARAVREHADRPGA